MIITEKFGYGVETEVNELQPCTCRPLGVLSFARGMRMRNAHDLAWNINSQRGCMRHVAIVQYRPETMADVLSHPDPNAYTHAEVIGGRQECQCDYPGMLCAACDTVAVKQPAIKNRCFLCNGTHGLRIMAVNRWACADLAGCMARRREGN